MPSESDIATALAQMGISYSELLYVRSAENAEEMEERLRAFQGRLRSSYRRAVRELHPDVSSDSGEVFVLVSEVHAYLKSLTVKRQKSKKLKISFTL